jgi:hypothetical protein
MATKNEKFKNASCFLMFSALSEIMLSMYEETKLIVHYDPYLTTKLRNLKVNFENATKRAFLMFPDDEQLSYMKMITVFEKLIESSRDEKKFIELMGLIQAWQNDEITMINDDVKLLEMAESVKNSKSL